MLEPDQSSSPRRDTGPDAQREITLEGSRIGLYFCFWLA
jgi:hypothetical protein